MRIRQICIRNLRGIREFDWVVPDKTLFCLIGRGDSTKSTILEALRRAFYPQWNLTFDDADFYQCAPANPVLSKNPIDAVRRADSTLDARQVATFVTAESLCEARPVCRLFPTCCSSASWPSRPGSTSSSVTSLTLSRKRIASSESRSVLAVSGSPTPSAAGDGYAVTCTPWSRPRPSSAGIDS